MKKAAPYLLLAVLIIFTGCVAVNSYNSGVYADAHGLDGASVGWFAPVGVPVLFASGIITFVYGLLLLTRTKK